MDEVVSHKVTEHHHFWENKSSSMKRDCRFLDVNCSASLTMCPPAAHRMEFDYLSDVPVLTMDVNEDFKGSKTKSADMIEKVSDR